MEYLSDHSHGLSDFDHEVVTPSSESEDDGQENSNEGEQQNHQEYKGLDQFEEGKNNEDYSDESTDLERKLNRLMRGDPFNVKSEDPIKFKVGQLFESVYTLRDLLKDYAIQKGVELKRDINDPERIVYSCKGEGYNWIIRARETIFGRVMRVHHYVGEHICYTISNNHEARVRWIVRKFQDLIKTCPKIDVETLSALLQRDYRLTVDRKKLYKVKDRVCCKLLKNMVNVLNC